MHSQIRLFNCEFEIIEINWLGNKIERSPVHGRADVAHVAVGRYHDRADNRINCRQSGQQRKAIHTGHINVAQHDVDIGLLFQHSQGFLPVVNKNEFIRISLDLGPKPLFEKRCQVNFIIN